MRLLIILITLCLPSVGQALEIKNGCACNLTGVCDCGPKCACGTFVSVQQPPDLFARMKAVEDAVVSLRKDVTELQAGMNDIKALLLKIDRTVSARQTAFPPGLSNPAVVGAGYLPSTTVYYSDAFGNVTACANGQCATSNFGVDPGFAAAPPQRVGLLRRLFGGRCK